MATSGAGTPFAPRGGVASFSGRCHAASCPSHILVHHPVHRDRRLWRRRSGTSAQAALNTAAPKTAEAALLERAASDFCGPDGDEVVSDSSPLLGNLCRLETMRETAAAMDRWRPPVFCSLLCCDTKCATSESTEADIFFPRLVAKRSAGLTSTQLCGNSSILQAGFWCGWPGSQRQRHLRLGMERVFTYIRWAVR